MLNKENKKKFEFQKSNNSNKTKSIKNQLRIKSASNQLNDINLNSSRTKEAIKLLGYSFEEFIFIPFKEYINLHQDVKTLPKEIQRKRYNFSEKLRKKKINDIINIKDTIDLKKIPKICNINFSMDNLLSKENILSSNIIDSINFYHYSRLKNENDLFNSIEYKLEKEIHKKENELKIRKKQLKDEEFKKEKELKEEIEKIELQEIDFLKRKFEEKEELDIKKKNLELYKEEQEKFKLNTLLEKEKQRKINEKNKEIEINRENYRKKVGKMNEIYEQKIKDKASSLENRHSFLRKELKKIKNNKMNENKFKIHKKKELILKNMKNLDNIYKIIQIKYEKKRELDEEKIKRVNETKLEKHKGKMEEAKLKEENIKNVIERNKLIKEIIKEKILNNIKLKQKKTEQNLNIKNIKIQNKNEENNEINLIKQSNINRMKNIKEREREIELISIINKEINSEKFKRQKKALSEQHFNFNSSLSFRKKLYDEELEKLFHMEKIDEKTKERLNEIFPNNQRIENLIFRLIQLENEEENDLKDYNNKIEEMNSIINRRKKLMRKNINISLPNFKEMDSNEIGTIFESNITELDKSIKNNSNKIKRKKNYSTKSLQTDTNKNTLNYLNTMNNTPQKSIINNNSNYIPKCVSGRICNKNYFIDKKLRNEVKKPKKPLCLDKTSDNYTNQNSVSSFKTTSYMYSNRSGNKILYFK